MCIRNAGLRYSTPGARVLGTEAVIAVRKAPALQEEIQITQVFSVEGAEVQSFERR
jgi:hypothetical protein